MESKYKQLKFINKYHLLSLIASIPALMLIVHILFPTLESFICDHVASDFLALGVLVLLVTLLVDSFQYGLCLIYLAYRYLQSVRKEEPLPAAFWIVNGFFCSKIFIFYISLYILESTSISGDYEFISNPIYVIFLLIIGGCCSTKTLKNDKLIFFLFFIFIVVIGGLLTLTLVVSNDDYFLIQIQLVWYAMFFSEILLMKQILGKPYLADKWIGWKRLLLLLLIYIPLITWINSSIQYELLRH